MMLLLVVMCCMATEVHAQDKAAASTCDDDMNAVAILKSTPRAPTPYHMSVLDGDVDRDGLINISDLTELINMLLTGETIFSGDVDKNGHIDIDDVTTLIHKLLTGDYIMENNQAFASLHEIYTSMRTFGWTTTVNHHQSFGISAYNLMAEVMGDDMIMGAQGNGWFWYDAAYSVKQRYTSTGWRSYDLWTAYYTWIANANYMLQACQSMNGTSAEKNYVEGQAYAIRAYSYFMLAQTFARTYKGHENDPCVPLFKGTYWWNASFWFRNTNTSAIRSTVAQVYAQIDADIDQAINLLNGTTQQNPEHIGYAVAQGLKARIALVKEDWTTAYNSAVAAINASNKSIQDVPSFIGVNDVTAGNVMWGADIPHDENTVYASLWSHMSSTLPYGQNAPKMISLWLYNKMSNTDTRRAWWKVNNTGAGPVGYVQQKFDVIPGTEWDGDYIWMRVEEMYLTAAEAACRRGLTTSAKNYLTRLMSKRDPNYSCSKTGTALGTLTTDETGSLLEEILIQRRIELWGEDGRIYTIRRLRQGFERTTENGWPSGLLLLNRSLQDPESYAWVLTIPQTEFYDYYSRLIFEADQNPIGDYPENNTPDIERTPQHISFVKSSQDIEISPTDTLKIPISMKRPNTSTKPYIALLMVTDASSGGTYFGYVHFAKNSKTATGEIAIGNNQQIGNSTFIVSLTDLEMSVANSSQTTAMTVNVNCHNIDPEGQNISFETANQVVNISADEQNTDYYNVQVPLTRAITTYGYRANVNISDEHGNVVMYNTAVNFAKGESTATASVSFNDIEPGNTYSCKLSLSDDDVATGDPNLNQITSTTVTLNYTPSIWTEAGTCTFMDNSWDENDPQTATDVPVQRMRDTNYYRIVSPLFSAYGYSMGYASRGNWYFYLNDDGSISPVEGEWELDYWGFLGYYSTQYTDYCYVEQNGNTYDVNFLLKNGSSLYIGGHFTFTWNK